MIKRSISMPVKPRYIDESTHLERSEEREELFTEDDLSESSNNFLNNLSASASRDNKCNEPTPDQPQEYSMTWQEYTDDDLSVSPKSDGCSSLKKFLSFHSKQKRQQNSVRLINKNGSENISHSRIPQRSLRYCQDFVTTLVEMEWKYTLIVFLLSYLLSWIIFTALWYIIGYAHGDFIFDEATGARLGEGKEPCVIGATSLTGLFIYTVETQATIGFGEKYPSEECPEGIFLFAFQIIVSIAIEGAMIGIMYAKLSKVVNQGWDMKFTKNAVINQQDEKLSFCFRVYDPREEHSIGTRIRIDIVKDEKSMEMEISKVLEPVSEYVSSLLSCPKTICHFIDESSPLRKYILDDLHEFDEKQHFEIIVSLVGASPTTGQVTESRTSYLPTEILWGQTFPNIIDYDWTTDTYTVDCDNFNTTAPGKWDP